MNIRTIVHGDIVWTAIATASILLIFLLFGMEIAAFALLGMLIFWWTYEYPEKSFLTLIILAPLLPLLKATQTLGNATLIKDVIIIALFLRTFLFPLLTQSLPYRRNALFAPLVALATWACFSVLRSGITPLSVLRLRDIGLYMVLYFAVLYLPHTAQRMKMRLIVFLATLAVVMTLGVFQFLYLPDSTVLRFDPVREIWIPRIASTLAHPSVFAQYLITGATLILGLIFAARHLRLQRKRWQEIGATSILLCILTLLYLTYTRAGWLGFAFSFSLMGITYVFLQLKTTSAVHVWKRSSMLVALLALCVIVVAAYSFTPVGTFVKSAFDPNYASNADRIVFIIHLISQTSNTDAVIGKGLGNTITEAREGGNASAFDIASGRSRTIQLSKDQTLVDNQYLKTFIEMGTVGVVLTFWLFWRFVIASKDALKKRTYSSFVLGIASVGFLAAFTVQALFVDIWDIFPTNAIFWTLAALVSQVRK